MIIIVFDQFDSMFTPMSVILEDVLWRRFVALTGIPGELGDTCLYVLSDIRYVHVVHARRYGVTSYLSVSRKQTAPWVLSAGQRVKSTATVSACQPSRFSGRRPRQECDPGRPASHEWAQLFKSGRAYSAGTLILDAVHTWVSRLQVCRCATVCRAAIPSKIHK